VEQALERLNTSSTRPVVLDVLNSKAIAQLRAESGLNIGGDQYLLCLGFEGIPEETDWQVKTVQTELSTARATHQLIGGEEADAFWAALTEFQTASDDPLTFRACVPASGVMELVDQATRQGVALQAHAGNGIIIGHLPDRCPNPEAAARLVGPLREFVERKHGSLVLLQGDDDWMQQVGSFGAVLPGEPLMRSLKAAFDPAWLLSPGRLWERSGPSTSPVA
jgi:glycolate oxidase FAD binding subunit